MKDALKDLSENEIDFICEECNLTKEDLFNMDEDTLYCIVYEAMCDIECAETPSDNTPLSDHCKIASAIVTTLGNAMADANGWLDEPDED